MANMKALARDTAIYGLSSIVGRFLNYLLVPLYTYRISAESGGYGVVTNLYAYTALLLVFLIYGMETTFFRFANKEGEDPKMVYSTILRMVGTTSLLFVGLVLAFLGPVSSALGYADHPSYVWTMAVIVALDAFQAILFSFLRYRQQALKFASLKLLFIGLNIGLNLLFFVVLPDWHARNPEAAARLYDPSVGVGYVFYINLFCTALITFFFAGELRGIGYGFDPALCRRLLAYSWPILLLGVAGILNQTADKILFRKIYPGADADAQLGIYGAASKIAMIMAMITQAFRYAYEPFVFAGSRDRNNGETYAKGMKYFVIFTLLAFLCVMGYMGLLRHIIAPDYWDGLRVVPIVMAAEIMMGVYFNLSFWYKLTDKTIWGAVFSGAGCAVLLAVNFIFVPKYGYMACAWGGFAGYGTAMILSYAVGQRCYPIAYPLRDMVFYTLLAAVLYLGIRWTGLHLGTVPALLANTVLIGIFAACIIRRDLPLGSLPVIGKYFKS